MIKVQKENFSIENELKTLLSKNDNIGAVSTFTGIVRNKAKDQELVSMTLEHYPGMTESMLEKIEKKALLRWELLDSLIIHRYGELFPGENIVLVISTQTVCVPYIPLLFAGEPKNLRLGSDVHNQHI